LKTVQDIKQRAEEDLLFFAKLVNPGRMYGEVHEELFRWWIRESAKDNQMVLLPRDHQKSHCAAVRAAWELTRDPSITILYVSATSDLAEKQLYAIKNILTSEVYRRYWPEMINEEEGKRERWNTNEIIVDHPVRKREGVRDPSIKAAGLTTNITGFHATHVFLDDLVVPSNAYTEEGRSKVAALYSQLASIETTGAKEVIVGTRYHPSDLYATIKEIKEEIFDDEGDVIGFEPVYEVIEKVVEKQGVFLWPREMREDGKMYGFDNKELARKKAKYVDTTQFYAQYYNDPNDPSSQRIGRDKFQYYDQALLRQERGSWMIKDRKLNVFAAMDFAFSLRKKADYTAIVVIGVDSKNQVYVLDIDRFKSDKIVDYYNSLLALHNKWGFRKVRCEVSVAQRVIVKELKDNYIVPNGLMLSVDEYNPSRHEGTKEERIQATLEPRYYNQSIWHYKGGLCTLLEEEIIQARPAHDDIKDALTAAVDIAVAPSYRPAKRTSNVYHGRFGGVRYAG
jgi:hypothetical protein